MHLIKIFSLYRVMASKPESEVSEKEWQQASCTRFFMTAPMVETKKSLFKSVEKEKKLVGEKTYMKTFFGNGNNNQEASVDSQIFLTETSATKVKDCDIQEDARHEKPKCSYADLIKSALASSAEGKLTLSEIYAWIKQNYPFFRKGSPVWQNSIRHNLSLNKSFKKICREPNSVGKGGYWAIDETFEPRKKVYIKRNPQYGVPKSLAFTKEGPKARHGSHKKSLESNVSICIILPKPSKKKKSSYAKSSKFQPPKANLAVK